MAIGDSASQTAATFSNLPIQRQVGLLVGFAASIAIGVGVVLWAKEPNYSPLLSQLNSRDAAEVVDVLQRNGIVYKLNKTNSTVLVQSSEISQARLKLASEGLPRGSGHGFEYFANSNSFTTSQFMESARMRHALETELARTISQFNNIKSARIHLAIPRESAFVRNNKKASASVFVDIYSGTQLRKSTIASVVNLVASSVPNMNSEHVTVVDQKGQLLSEGGGHNVLSISDRFMDYRQELENDYASRIQDILTPILGYGKVRAKVSADIDFTLSEQTRELYNPDLPAIRSEQRMEEKRKVSTENAGVAGALSNQASGKKNQPQEITKSATTQQGAGASDFRVQSTKNFELDKTISHTKNQPGRIKRLSVAVLVDNRQKVNPNTGKLEDVALSKDEIEKIKLLVTDAVGLNMNRGDSLNVINSNFVKPLAIEPIPSVTIWQQDWFWTLIKQFSGGMFLLVLVLGVLRPMLKSLAGQKTLLNNEGNNDPNTLANKVPGQIPNMSDDYDTSMNMVRSLAGKEPKKVAQVVKTWVDGGKA
jgi:flagellar M-ring protein FliF